MKTCLLPLFTILFFSCPFFAQISTVEGFNYYDINRAAFTVDTDCDEIPVEQREETAYLLTALQLAETVNGVFNGAADSVDQVIGNYKIVKRPFFAKRLGGEYYRWVLIRPNDEVDRPVVLITHGGKSAGAGSRRVLSLGVYDLVQRGYAVVYYQSAPGPGGNAQESLAELGFENFCISDAVWTPDVNVDCFQQAVYLRYLSATAAFQYAVGTQGEHHLDIGNIFAMGFSGGAIATIYGALANEEDFTDPLFTEMNNLDSLSLFPEATFEVKAVSSLAGGILHPSTEGFKIGENVVDAGDANTRFLLFHGQDDYAVRPRTAPLAWSLPQGQLPGSRLSGSIDFGKQLDAENIPNKIVITCSGNHDVFAYPCQSNDDNFVNNPDYGVPGPCVNWLLDINFTGFDYNEVCSFRNIRLGWDEAVYVLQQIHDYGKITAHFFHQDFADSGPAAQPDAFVTGILDDPAPSAVNPLEYPYAPGIGNNNGHWGISEKCLQQECAALYFNKRGTGNTVLYKGDVVTIPTAGLPGFNDDFTLEMRITPSRLGGGQYVLFSELRNGSGIEIYLDTESHLTFKKTVGTPATIIGQSQLQTGKCYHVALRRAGNVFSLYLNGVLQDREKTYDISLPRAPQILVGNTAKISQNGGFEGGIQYFRIWNSAIFPSAFDVQDLTVDATGLAANWQFNGYYEQSWSSTNGLFTATLGNNTENENYDPRWIEDDVDCNCVVDIINSTSTPQAAGPEVSVSPNPSPRRIVIRQPAGPIKPLELVLYNASGQAVQRATMRTRQHKMFLRNAGVYFLHASAAGATTTKKVVVQ